MTRFFGDFWQASSIDAHNLTEFAQQMAAFDTEGRPLRLEYSTVPTPLPEVRRGAVDRVAARRHSTREFSDRPLSDKELSRLLASCRAWGGAEHRSFPSAGASYAVELFLVQWRPRARMAYYDAVDHGLVELPDPAPAWEEATHRINVSVTGTPAAMVVAVLFPERLTRKYGERGGRFALLEAGAVMQQLALATAELGLAGVVAGGLVDRYWLTQLGVERAGGILAFGQLVGHPLVIGRRWGTR
ncbi:MAG: SagB/ThcOx family dehydrogenase [Arachnia propionica]|uniref:SagB/ThcOx family dehydrogenase n=1 Tax=Arachnia propionica TaxID=1750 RepID=UPI00270A125E|nr:SagB/ThcOx family dehydrogenase [Arachnia propionica]